MIPISLRVTGIPAPGGSKSAHVLHRRDGSMVMRKGGGGPVINMVDAGKRNKDWRAVVSYYAAEIFKTPLTGALEVKLEFFFVRPQGHFKGNDRSRPLKANAPRWHTKKPDAIKIARSTEDALTGIAWHDDAANVFVSSRKSYADWNGCNITITPVEETPAAPCPSNGELFAEMK